MLKNLKDYVVKLENFLDKDFCDQTINQLKIIDWKQHEFYNPITKALINRSGSNELEVSQENILNKGIIMDKLHGAIKEYINRFNFPWFTSWKGYSSIRFNRYTEDKRMALHCDHISSVFDGKKRGIPILSCLGTLNNDYSGGEFVILEDEIIELKKGELLIFPSNFLYPHRVKPVNKGIRYSYISWVY